MKCSFDDAVHGKPFTMQCIHYGKIEKLDTKKSLYVTDYEGRNAWKPMAGHGFFAYILRVTWRNPYVELNSTGEFEVCTGSRDNEYLIRIFGYDGIIHTPDRNSPYRQAVVYPPLDVEIIRILRI